MKRGKKWVLRAVLAGLLGSMMVMPSMAATKKKITSVEVVVEPEIEIGESYGDETINIKVRGSDKYYYDSYEVQNQGFEWLETDVPEIIIYLNAQDGYYFALTKASDVTLKGATYVKATKQQSSTILKLQVKLPSLEETVDEVDTVYLDESGFASWKPVRGAGSYEVRLYRNDTSTGAVAHTTQDNFYDFRAKMKREGNYYAKVRPINKINASNKGEWVESADFYLTKDMAAAIREGTSPEMFTNFEAVEGITGEWKGDEMSGWWYEHSDGTYKTNGWELIDGEWYFFDGDGYMQTGWIDWDGKEYYCDDDTGAMLTQTTTPDGIILDANGNPKND